MTDEMKELEGTANENPPAMEESSEEVQVIEDKAEEIAAVSEPAQEEIFEPVFKSDIKAAQEETFEPVFKQDVKAEQEETPEPVQAKPKSEESGNQMDYSETFRSLSAGDVVRGVVVHIDKEGVLVDVGTKSEGIIRPNELTSGPTQPMEDVVSVGDKIDVYVIQPEGDDGNLILSKKRADFENAWEHLQEAHEKGTVLTAMVTDRVKGGLVVDLGIRGFVPGSHVGNGRVKNLDRYVGQSLPLKVIEVDRERRKVVLSHRLATEEERSKERESTVASMTEGQIRDGVVRRTTEYGAFIDLGGIDGLLHISEMSWTRIGHPSDVVKVGQKLQVMILKINLDAGRVSLGLRQILPDPWAKVKESYRVGDVVKGAVSRMVPFGAFVQLEGGIEGIIPNAELRQKRVSRPEDVVSVGEVVEARVIDIRTEERRMTLSIRQMQEEKEHKEYESYQSSRSDGRMTLGDLIGDKLQELTGSAAPVKVKKTKKPKPEVVEEPAVTTEAEVVENAPIGEVEVVEEAAPKKRSRKKAAPKDTGSEIVE